MSSKKSNIASQALLDMDTIVSAIKEESKKSLNMMLDEAVRNVLRENCCKEDENEDEYEVVDDKKEKNDNENNTVKKSEKEDDETENSEKDTDDEVEVGPEEESEVLADAEADSDETTDGDEWDEYSDYKVDDDTYDLTGEQDQETVAKVYKLLTNDDNIIIRQDGNKLQLTDDEAGTEYVIDLGNEDSNSEEHAENINEVNDIAGFENGLDNENEFEIELDDETPNEIEDDDTLDIELGDLSDNENFEDYDEIEDPINENKNNKKMKGKKQEVLFEVDLGYTDRYQDKDPIGGLSMNEPSKTGKSWDKGLPTGTEKPWAGPSKDKGTPFKETKEINEEDEDILVDNTEEIEEGTNVGGAVQQRSNSKSHIPNNRKEHGPKVKRHVSTAGPSTADDGYTEAINECKKLKAENEKLKKAVLALKENLTEAYVTNVNLGKITKLFLENTTSQKEKVEIVNRFCNEAKTVKDSEKLYESIKTQLNAKQPTLGITLEETSKTANGSKAINENKVYKSNDLMKTIDLINRMQQY